MSLIEEAAKRLQLLHQAGIDMGMPLGPGAAAPKRTPAKRTVRKAGTAVPRRTKKGAKAQAADAGVRTLDLVRLQAAGLAAPDSTVLGAFRSLKRPLVENALRESPAPPPNARRILVTSASPGEGKTFVAVNLAMSIALDADAPVLLVDAHLAAPAVAATLGVEAGKGLAEALTDRSISLQDAVVRTSVERLSLLFAGAAQEGADTQLAGDAMAHLLAEISARYPDHLVVLDAPPLLGSEQTRSLAARAGQVVVVAEAGRTTRAALETALSALESCPVVMTLLNKTAGSESFDLPDPAVRT